MASLEEQTPKVAEKEEGAEVPKVAEKSVGAAAAEEPEDEADGEGGDGAGLEEEVSTAVFKPLVTLEEVEVVSGEENEDAVFSLRGRLYRFTETLLDKGTGKKQWIERGVGEVKLLKNRESQQQRFLMRQEKTLKLIINSGIDPRIRMKNMDTNDKTWVWTCYDFSDAVVVEEIFAFKCSSIEDAAKFKEAFDKAVGEMAGLLHGADATPSPTVDAAAAALDGLSAKLSE